MKKSILFVGLLVMISIGSFSQMVAEDAKGQTSILNRNSNIGLNLTEALLSVSLNNFRKWHVAPKHSQVMWQIAATGKNEEGLGVLWNEGNLQATSRLEGFIGIRFNGYRDEYALIKELNKKSNDASLEASRQLADYVTPMLALVTADNNISVNEKKLLRGKLLEFSKKPGADMTSVSNDATTLKGTFTAPADLAKATALQNVIVFLGARKGSLAVQMAAAKIIRDEMSDINSQLDILRGADRKSRFITVFLNFGMNASTYTLFVRPSVIPFADRFDTSKYRGGFAEIGINYDTGPNWVFGLSAGFERANTFDSLKKREYTVRTSETSGTQSFVGEKKYPAYSGFYEIYTRGTLKTDFLYYGKINDEFRFVWNTLYLRFYLPMGNDKVNGICNLGSSFNFYKANGKFAGGIYLQQNDTFNKLEEDNSTFWKRLNLGITTKFSFSSIVR